MNYLHLLLLKKVIKLKKKNYYQKCRMNLNKFYELIK